MRIKFFKKWIRRNKIMKKLNDLACEMSALSFTISNHQKKLKWVLDNKERCETRQKMQVKQAELKKLQTEFNNLVNEVLCEKKTTSH